MGDIEPGWYDDTEDPTLARWWDGRAWTEHTLVISDQLPGTEPAPPVSPSTRFPVPRAHEWLDDPAYADEPEEPLQPDDPRAYVPIAPAAAPARGVTEEPARIGSWAWPPARATGPDEGEVWHRLDDADDEELVPRRRRGGLPQEQSFGERVRELPLWVRLALPVAAIVLLVAAVASAGDGEDGGGATTDDTTVSPQQLRAAADHALDVSDVSWFTRQGFLASLPPLCTAAADGAPERVADRIILLGYDDATAARLVLGLEAGAQDICPEDLAEHPGFFEEVARLAQVDLADAVTTTTIETTTTTAAVTTTTRSTPTTRRATPPPTQAPPTTAAPTTTTTAPTTTTVPTPTTAPPETTTGGAPVG